MYKRIKRAIARWLNVNYAPYVIVAEWEHGRAVRKTTIHYAWSWDDAMDWLACYMPCDRMRVHWRSVLGLGESQVIAGR